MVSLTFWGGINEIGGNKILLEDQNTRLFLDFGMSFSLANQYFDEFMQPRKCSGILDLLEFGLLPNLDGIYRCDYLNHCRLPFEETCSIDGLLLSHAHMDHSSYIHYLRELSQFTARKLPKTSCKLLTKLVRAERANLSPSKNRLRHTQTSRAQNPN